MKISRLKHLIRQILKEQIGPQHWYCPDRSEECEQRSSGGPDTYPTKAECEAQTWCESSPTSTSPGKAPYKSKQI